MNVSTCLSTSPAKFEAVPFKGDLEQNISDILTMGFDGIELAVRDPEIIDQEKVLEMILTSGLKIPAIGTGQAWGEEGLSFTDPDPKIRKKAVARVFSQIDFAKKAGAVVIIGLLRGIAHPGVSQKQAEEWMYKSFSDCCREAEKKSVMIAFEPINRYETSLLNRVDEGLDFIERVGGGNLGMLLDSFHMNIEEPSIEASIKIAGSRIFHFHYADSNRWYPGAGHLDFKSIMRTLYSTGYHRFVSGEHRPDPQPRIAAENGLKFMRMLEKEL